MSRFEPLSFDGERPGLAVNLERVSAGYGSVNVLEDLDFEAESGAMTFICGPTAAGKSSLMNLLRLALPPRGGRAMILGADAGRLTGGQRARMKRRIGAISEQPMFVEHWSTFDNVALPIKISGRKDGGVRDDVQELLAYVGLNTAADDPVGRLSAAERRRAAIARALAAKPDLIIADEPTAGLSPDAADRVMRLLEEMSRVGVAVIFLTQSEHLADGLAASVWRMEHGRIEPLYLESSYAGDAEW